MTHNLFNNVLFLVRLCSWLVAYVFIESNWFQFRMFELHAVDKEKVAKKNKFYVLKCADCSSHVALRNRSLRPSLRNSLRTATWRTVKLDPPRWILVANSCFQCLFYMDQTGISNACGSFLWGLEQDFLSLLFPPLPPHLKVKWHLHLCCDGTPDKASLWPVKSLFPSGEVQNWGGANM